MKWFWFIAKMIVQGLKAKLSTKMAAAINGAVASGVEIAKETGGEGDDKVMAFVSYCWF